VPRAELAAFRRAWPLWATLILKAARHCVGRAGGHTEAAGGDFCLIAEQAVVPPLTQYARNRRQAWASAHLHPNILKGRGKRADPQTSFLPLLLFAPADPVAMATAKTVMGFGSEKGRQGSMHHQGGPAEKAGWQMLSKALHLVATRQGWGASFSSSTCRLMESDGELGRHCISLPEVSQPGIPHFARPRRLRMTGGTRISGREVFPWPNRRGLMEPGDSGRWVLIPNLGRGHTQEFRPIPSLSIKHEHRWSAEFMKCP